MGPTVADEIEWEALPEDQRERFKAVIYEEVKREVMQSLGFEHDADMEDLQDTIDTARDLVDRLQAVLS